jgi:ribonuclease HI
MQEWDDPKEQCLYTDGGVIGRNPSKLGGTWAWCLIDECGRMLKRDSGVVDGYREKLKVVTNNYTELFAAVTGLWAVGKDFCGTVVTDSQITMGRLTRGTGFAGIPQWLRLRTLELGRNRKWRVELVAGHPTQKDLARGYKIKMLKTGGERRYPVSKWNVWVDERCQMEAKKFMETSR